MWFTMWMTRQIRMSVNSNFYSMLRRSLLHVCMQIVCVICYCLYIAQFQTVHAVIIRPIDRDAHTIYYTNQASNTFGEFHYEFQTTNGITEKAAGNEFGFSGAVQYISPEGIPITMTYTADANGYRPVGDHIPKLPEQVLSNFLSLDSKKRQQTTANEPKT